MKLIDDIEELPEFKKLLDTVAIKTNISCTCCGRALYRIKEKYLDPEDKSKLFCFGGQVIGKPCIQMDKYPDCNHDGTCKKDCKIGH